MTISTQVAGGAIILLFIIVPIVVGIVVFIRSDSRDLLERILLALLAPAMGIALWVVCFCIVDFGVDDWSAAKLAPIVAMVRGSPHGYSLYQDPLSGVMTGWIYGPVSAIFFLPVIAFDHPTPALLCGSVINLLSAFVPVAWILFQCAVSGRSQKICVPALTLGICLFITLCLQHVSLRMAIFQVGADAPSLGLAALSLALLIDHRGWVRLILSAFAASLAVCSKQSLLPIVFVGPAYLFFLRDRAAAIRLLMLTAGAFVVVVIALVIMFGPASAIWFHMVRLPASHSWVESGLPLVGILLGICGNLFIDYSQALAILLLVIVVCGGSIVRNRGPWIMFLAAAVVGIPGALLGRVKVGGDVNNFAMSSFFFVLAVTSLLTQLLASLEWTDRRGLLLRQGICLVIVAINALVVTNSGEVGTLKMRLADPSDNSQELVYRYMKQHPDVAYFPWNPLPAVYVKGKLYHFEWGLIDRFLRDPTLVGSEHAQQLIAHIPTDSQIVAVPETAKTLFALKYFPKFKQSTPSSELPSFWIYTLPPATQPGSVSQ